MKNRVELVKAMDLLVRSVNNEDLLDPWFMCGVADGDVENDDLEYYTEDDNFAELMKLFLNIMSKAKSDGGLYFDRVVSK